MLGNQFAKPGNFRAKGVPERHAVGNLPTQAGNIQNFGGKNLLVGLDPSVANEIFLVQHFPSEFV